MKALLATLSLLTAEPTTVIEPTDTLLHIDRVEITASLKSDEREPISATRLSMHRLEERGVSSVKELSALAPNFYQPDYGSSITSSIYVRGFGSRIDQPVLGMVVDDVVVMNKNAYDFDFYDVRSVELLRGPQGTLYGRNTSGGVMLIRTLQPLAWQGMRFMAEYATLSSAKASLAYYAKPNERFGVSVAALYSHDGGHFRNTYTDKFCDSGDNGSIRLRMQWLAGRWSLDNILSAGYTSEGGYAYHHFLSERNEYEPIAYNDPSAYERLTLSEGFVAKYTDSKVRLSLVTGYHLLRDKMTLDQDFTPRNMFTLEQRQFEHSLTEDFVIRNAENHRRWQWLCGVFGFAKWLDISSPVRFKQDGINDLILANANKGIASGGLSGEIKFDVDNFVIDSDFRIPTYGAALYHQSSWRLGRWQLSAGIRLDWEMSSMRYNSRATVPYRFTLTMNEFKPLSTEFKGRERQHFFELLPKISAEYRFDSRNSLYATITRGYKSGGFNTQIFSDILQVKMMTGLMESLGVYIDDMTTTTYDSASATRYKPETSWNFEVGTHLAPIEGLTLSGALFWIECFDQQVTVLPKGMSTGRMMSNAARARSFGIELSAHYRYRGLTLAGDYGYTNARFRDYDDGTENYAGNFLPYAPQNTVSLVAGYSWLVDNRVLNEVSLSVDWRGVGAIYWNEANTLKQPMYSLLGAQLQLRMGRYTLSLWGRNLTNTRYDVFYFKSVGEEFFSWGKPLQCGLRLNINL